MKSAMELLIIAVSELAYGRTIIAQSFCCQAEHALKRENEARGTMVATVIEDEAYARGFRDAKQKITSVLDATFYLCKPDIPQVLACIKTVKPTPEEEIDYYHKEPGVTRVPEIRKYEYDRGHKEGRQQYRDDVIRLLRALLGDYKRQQDESKHAAVRVMMSTLPGA